MYRYVKIQLRREWTTCMMNLSFWRGVDGLDGFASGEERDQKVSVGLGGVPPWAFRHRSLLKTSLGSSPMTQLPVLPAGPSKPPENKIAAVGSTKRLRWSHNDYLRLVGSSYPLTYCPPGRGSYRGLSWHTSFVGVPGYSWYCPPGSRATCESSVL